MHKLPYTTALIVGAGPGVSASVARALAREGVKVGLASRSTDKLASLAAEIGAEVFAADATDEASVAALFDHMESKLGPIDVVLYNAAARVQGAIPTLDPGAVKGVIAASTYAAFLVVQQAARRMIPRKTGAILLTGASASVKGYANSAAFAMGMFGRRGLAQSAARELGPQGIHVAHFVIDGSLRTSTPEPADKPDSTLDSDAVAETYLHVLRQHRSAWTWEVEVRPWVERF
ncbi:SDR family NAD(P)-dependent oxidoreductase [Caenimonas soli]|uniref:SDR family NAD(P)-dependent oxidoreductase n=1 Tax=Caenimonas soli TaxID=2735555 RepID=UPI001556EE15|nr:SDR family NAD(P)-dependent oxidoreductase [Caenimonas soli]NPC58465.1 SDR family NAD(P)-dependent oxidoreductase [Caenimonas soli]